MKIFKITQSYERQGFALISTLSIMALLVMLVIGMMSLATTESKVADATKYEMEAKANARMALMIALGELQEEVGPDQRITGNASIFANDGSGNAPNAANFDPTSIDSSYENPHLLGVWDSWTTWLSGDSDPSEIAATYDRGRTSQFRRFLVSHPDSEDMSPSEWRNFAEGGSSALKIVPLIKNVLGDDAADNDIVEAPLIETPNGAYAWHVSGNNQKTNVSLGSSDRDREVAGSAAGLANVSSHGLNETIDNSLSNYPVDALETERAVSLQTSSLVDSGATEFLKEYYRENYHAYTADSQTVLANVRKGGLKKDLNAYLELDLGTNISSGQSLRDEFGLENNPEEDRLKTIRDTQQNQGYTGSPRYNYPTTGKPNFPTWYKLHQYYQSYKGDDANVDEDGTSQIGGISERKGIAYDSGSPHLSFNISQGNMYQRGYSRAPVASRFMVQLGARRNRSPGSIDQFYLTFNPILQLWNPYNVPIEVPRITGIIRMQSALEWKLSQRGIDVTNGWLKLSDGFRAGGDLKVFTTVSSGSGQANENPYVLAPGETRIFSINPGDEPVTDSRDNANNSRRAAIEDDRITLSPGYTQDYVGHIIQLTNNGRGAGGAKDIKPRYDPSIATQTRLHLRMVGTPYRADESFNNYWLLRVNDQGTPNFSEMGWRQLPEPSTTPLPDGSTEAIPLTLPGGRPIPEEPVWYARSTAAFANVGFALKGGPWFTDPANDPDQLNSYSGKDYRSKSFILGNPANLRSQVVQATDRQLALGQYEFFQYTGSAGSLDINHDQATGQSESFGSYGDIGLGSDWDGQRNAPLKEIPLSPAYSLASLQNFAINLGTSITTAPGQGNNRGWHAFEANASNFGLGIGNAYAHPMIEAGDIYGFAADGEPTNTSVRLQRLLNVDVWDHLFMQNDALYDEWFTSTLTAQDSQTFDDKRDLGTVFDEFADGTSELPNQHLVLDTGDVSVETARSEILGGNDFEGDAYEKVARYLLLNGGFNVNSTSVNAWKGLFYGLRTKELRYLPVSGGSLSQANLEDGSNPQGKVVLSRFTVPNGIDEGVDANDPNAWTGVRYLTEGQIDKLAQECVRQVKLRGPFLNMSDFVNRRLDGGDRETSRVGALQAAIDWDEFNGNSLSGGGDSINGRFKQGNDMITKTNSTDTWSGSNLPFAEAYYGSRWTGIPGYVMQGDLLKRIGNQITVRDDTFTIRAYGESKDAQGNVKAKAVCEAVVVRTPRYINHKEEGEPSGDGATPETAFDDLATTDDTNRRYGRKLEIKSFRWLSDKEV